MSDIDFLIRIVLRARDEMAGALAKARAELALFAAEADRADKNIKSLNTSLSGLNTRLTNLRTRLQGVRDDLRDVDRSAKASSVGMDALGDRSRSTTRELESHSRVTRDVDRDHRSLASRLEETGLKMQSVGFNVKSLGAEMRGLLILGAIGFFQQLATSALALGANLTALASSAAFAGAALGGAITAGVAQALPALGLLAAAVQRVGNVFQALKLQQQAQQQDFVQQEQRDKRAGNSANELASAMEGVQAAQERLTQARHDAGRQLEDLVQKEREAELAAKGANLTVEEAQRALREAIQSGDDLGVQRARLSLEQAEQGRQSARLNLQRANEDNAAAQARGVQNAQQVVDAERALENARRGVENAKRTADVAQNQAVTAQRNLDFFLQKQLTSSERALFEVLSRIRTQYQTVFTKVTDIIVDSFTHVARRVEVLFKNPRILAGLTDLAEGIADSITKISDSLLSSGMVEQLGRIAAAGKENLGPLTDILINLAKIFADIAESAGPALADLLDFIKDITDGWRKFIETARQDGSLVDFFKEGEVHLEAWVRLLGSVVNLFAAIAGAGGGADSGLRLITRMTDGLNKMADSIRKNPEGLREFFRESEIVLGQLFRLFKALATAIVESFDPGSVKALVNILVNIAIPALQTTIEAVSELVKIFEAFLSIPLVSRLAVLALSVLGVWRALTTLSRLFGTMLIQFSSISEAVGGLAGAGRTGLGALNAAFRAFSEGGIKGAIKAFKDYIAQAKLAKTASAEATAATEASAAGGAGAPFIVGPGGARTTVREGSPEHQAQQRARTRRARLRGAGIIGAVTAGAALSQSNADEADNLSDIAGRMALNIDSLKDAFGSLMGLDIRGFFGSLTRDNKELANFANNAAGNFEKLTKERNVGGLRDMAKHASEMAKDFPDAAGALGKFADEANAAADKIDKANKNLVGLSRFKDTIKGGLVKADDILDPNAVGQFLSNFNRMRREGVTSITDLRENMKFNLSQITRGLETDSDSWRVNIARNFGAGIDALKQAMEDGRISTRDGMAEINRITKRQMEFVRDNMDDLSVEAKDRLAANFRSARLAIEAQVGGIENATGASLRKIRRLMDQEFELLGLDPDSARRLARNRTTPGRTNVDQFGGNDRAGGGAIGGFFGQQGERGEDGTGPMLGAHPTGRGEALLNWAHQKYVDVALQGQFGHGLGEMFRRVRGEHSWRSPGGMAVGGFANALFNGHPSNVTGGIRDLIEEMKKRFQLVVSSTTDHSRLTTSGNVSDHVSGHAVDLAGSTEVMRRAAEYVKSSNIARRLKQGIHNPNLSINAGKEVPISFWGPAVWAQHANHLHLALAGALGAVKGGTSNLSEGIKRVLVKGAANAGALGAIAQARVDAVRNATNLRIRQVAAEMGADTDLHDGSGLAGLTSTGDVQSLDHTYPAHHSGDAKGHVQFDPDTVVKIAQSAGLPGRPFEQIAHGESNYYPGIISNDGGYGLWQMTPRVWGPAALRAMNALGGVGEMLNPLKNARMARFLYDAAGKTFSPWFGTRYLTFGSGGELPWKRGTPGMFMGHGGEWVLNEDQKDKVASWLGTSVDKLKGALGFSGGPGSFQGGGELPFQTRERNRKIREGDFELPDLNPVEPEEVIREFRRLARALDRMKLKAKESLSKFTDRFIGEVDNMVREGGLFDQMATAVERRSALRQTALTRRTFTVSRGGNITRRLDDDQVAAQQAKDAEAEAKELGDFRKAVADILKDSADRLRALNRRIADIRKGGVTKDERDTLNELTKSRTQLIGQQRVIRNKLNEIDSSIAESVQNRFDAAIERIKAQAEAANREAGRGLAALDRVQRLNDARGDLVDDSGARTEIINRQINKLKTTAQRLRRRGDKQGAEDIEDQIADLQVSIQEIILDAFHKNIDAMNKAFAHEQANIQGAQGIAESLGQTGVSQSLRQAAIGSMQRQIQALVDQFPTFVALGDHAGFSAALEQIDQLSLQIQQTAIDIFEATVTDINERAERSLGRLDIAQRAIGLGLVGTALGIAGAGTAGSVFAARGGVLAQQRAELQGQLGQAAALGNIRAMDELTDKIADLTVQIAENTEAFRTFRIEAINQRASFITGSSGTAQSIVQTMGQAVGAVLSTPALRSLIGTSLQALVSQGSGLREELKGLIGVDAGALNSPEAVTAFINNIIPIVEALPDTLRTTGESLVSALLQNAQSIQENTNQLNQLNNPNAQSFSSTAWTMFRNAIFNGSGGLLPNIALQSGLAMNGSGGWQFQGGSTMQHIDIDIHQAGDLDASALGNTIAFRLKHG